MNKLNTGLFELDPESPILVSSLANGADLHREVCDVVHVLTGRSLPVTVRIVLVGSDMWSEWLLTARGFLDHKGARLFLDGPGPAILHHPRGKALLFVAPVEPGKMILLLDKPHF